MNRRTFLRRAAGAGAAGMLLPEGLRAAHGDTPRRLVVLHTNDTHSRMDPFPMDGGPFQGLGGAARRATLIRRIRDANEHVLLVDSGDVFQGTPYFNFFGGELEFRAMTAMGYDVGTLGNHDFDNGVDGLADMLPEADFELVSANYDVSGTRLAGHVKPWVIREYDGLRVGIFGLGIGFAGLVLADLHAGVTYHDPLEAARTVADELRAEGCGLVICLSHLGYRYEAGGRPSDRDLAHAVPEVDLVLGGHTHTFLDEPERFPRRARPDLLVAQTGWGGMRLGRIDVLFDGAGGVGGSAAGFYRVDGALDR